MDDAPARHAAPAPPRASRRGSNPPSTPAMLAVVEQSLELARAGRPDDGLVLVVDALRPSRGDDAASTFDALTAALDAGGTDVATALGDLLMSSVARARCVLPLTESGIPFDHGFFEGLSVRIARRILPTVDRDDDLRALVHRVFHRASDGVWLRAIPESSWRKLMNQLGVRADAIVGVPDELAAAIRVLAHHVASLGLSSEITERMPDLDDLDSPFLAVSDAVLRYTQSFNSDIEGDEGPLLDAALQTLSACRDAVMRLRANKHVFGTSLRLTTLTFRLLRQIERLSSLLMLTQPEHRDVQRALLDVFLDIVEAECTRNRVRPHVRQSADLLAYQVVEHAARKGEKYIAADRPEYVRFLRSSLVGGAIVAAFALLKLELSALSMSLAAEAFAFSVNYALCFVLIHLLGATLATKQPAMTANALARSMDGAGGEQQLAQVTEMIIRVSRSQFISFVGNLACAFPLALVFAELHRAIAGDALATPAKAAYLFEQVHPTQGGALFYAAVAGVFLFIAGLVSGYFDNRNRYRQISLRIARHPLLLLTVGPMRAAALGAWVDKHGGAILGNVLLGVCLGTAGTLGTIFGAPFDIRHIAFSTAHMGTALDAVRFQVAPWTMLSIIVGVAGIGLVNFAVSFGLAFTMAATSRGITMREHRAVLGRLIRRLMTRPADFFVPPRPVAGVAERAA